MSRAVLRGTRPWSRDPLPGMVVVVFGIAILAFVILTASIIFFPAFQHLDARISDAIRSLGFGGVEAVARAFSFLGDRWTVAVLTAAGVAWLLVRRMRAEAVLLGATIVLGTTAGSVLKVLIERARPGIEFARIPVPESYSFPSGHALAAFLFFGICAFLFFTHAATARFKLRAAFACTFLVFAVAISRVVLGVHFLGDIIASWMLGSALLTLFVSVYVWWVTRESRLTRGEG